MSVDFTSIEEKKKIVENFRPFTQGELESYRENFLIEYTHDSTAIEGNSLTLRETALVLQGITIDKKPLRDHLEAIGHRDAFLYLYDIVKNGGDIDINENIIKTVHSLVLLDKAQDRGIYRRVPVIITGASHTPQPPYLIEPQMQELIELYHEMEGLHEIERAAEFHFGFERIHPFIDGNGRTGRLILNLNLLKNGYQPVNIKFADRMRYYNCFEKNNVCEMIKLVAEYEEYELDRYIEFMKSARE